MTPPPERGHGPRPPDLIVPRWPSPPPVRAVCTTRAGGVSRGPFGAFNLAGHVGDDADAVAVNRARLAARLGLPAEPLWMRQMHGARVLGAEGFEAGEAGDACVARAPAGPCVVLSADCLPILLCARAGGVIAAAHAGWRGLVAGVVENTVAAMDTKPAELIAWLGPAIGARAYEVGAEVREAFVTRDHSDARAFTPARTGRWNADLALIARRRLRRAGVAAVYGADLCTYSDPGRFYSFRRERRTGRMAALIWME